MELRENGFGLRSVGKMEYTSICYVPPERERERELLLIATSVSHKEGNLYRWCKYKYVDKMQCGNAKLHLDTRILPLFLFYLPTLNQLHIAVGYQFIIRLDLI
jgi:hypothetical protein